MNDKTTLNNITSVFFEEGYLCNFGVNENNLDDLWSRIIDRAGFKKKVYAVKNWIWYDINIDGNKFAVVKADYVLRTDNRRFDIGDWVRTSPIINFEDNCICETVSSYYILVGKGTRKDSDESIFSFFG